MQWLAAAPPRGSDWRKTFIAWRTFYCWKICGPHLFYGFFSKINLIWAFCAFRDRYGWAFSECSVSKGFQEKKNVLQTQTNLQEAAGSWECAFSLCEFSFLIIEDGMFLANLASCSKHVHQANFSGSLSELKPSMMGGTLRCSFLGLSLQL